MRKTKKRFLSALLACAMIISIFPFAAFAGSDSNDASEPKTIYVDEKNGNDSSNDGLSSNSAYATLEAALENANNGDIIKLAAGTYTTNVNEYVGVVVNLEGAGKDKTTIDGALWMGAPDGDWYNVSSVTVSGITFKNTDGSAFWSNTGLGFTRIQGTNITVDNCNFDGFQYGVHMNGTNAGTTLNITNTDFENTFVGISAQLDPNGAKLGTIDNVKTTDGAYAVQAFGNDDKSSLIDYYYKTVDAYETAAAGASDVTKINNSGLSEDQYTDEKNVKGYIVTESDDLQATINAAPSGATIIVAPGTYNGNIKFGNKSLTIKAQYPAYEDGKKQNDQSKLSKFTGTFNTFNDYVTHEDQTIVIEGFALSGDGLKIGNMNQNSVGNLQVRHCTMECGNNMTGTNENDFAGWNYFVKVSNDPTDRYAKVTVEDNYIFGTPATNITPIQLWQVDDVVVKNNKIELTNASDKQGINISKMAANANVEVTDNVISGAGGGIYVTTWQLDGVTQVENPATFNGTINIENNTIEVLNSSKAKPIFIGNENNDQPNGLIGGTIHATNNVDQNGNIITPVISQKDGDTTTIQATFMNNGELYEVCIGTKAGDSATIITPAAPTREGYTFKGWVANGERYNANARVTITADTTFTADWEAPYNGKYSYAINVVDTDNGSVSVDKYATEGEKVTLTVSPDKAYKLDELTVTANGKDVELTDNGDGTYTFTMPSSNVKVSASFVEDKDYVEPDNSITVSMTIGSNDFVINNNIVTVPDAAPYIANDRTYVPFRALGEALGAKVVWDNDARTVTYTLGDTEIVMTIGDTTYTINGVEKSMDVAPEITGDRTYVPVRFVAEGLGFKVTPLYADNGTTASVVFEK